VGLVAIAGGSGDLRHLHSTAGKTQRTLEAQHPPQHLRAVAERGQRTSVELFREGGPNQVGVTDDQMRSPNSS
jgi:hypothetical protein